MSTWNMPPGVTTNDIPGQDSADDIEMKCDDLRIAMQNLEANGADARDYARVLEVLEELKEMARRLSVA